MYITSGISIRNDAYYNHMDTRYSMNYRVRIADIFPQSLYFRALWAFCFGMGIIWGYLLIYIFELPSLVFYYHFGTFFWFWKILSWINVHFLKSQVIVNVLWYYRMIVWIICRLPDLNYKRGSLHFCPESPIQPLMGVHRGIKFNRYIVVAV